MAKVTENWGCDDCCKYNGSLYFESECDKCPWCKFTLIGQCKCYRSICHQCDTKYCNECIFQNVWNKCNTCFNQYCFECGKWETLQSYFQCQRCKGDEDENNSDEYDQGEKCPKSNKIIIDIDLDEHFEKCLEEESEVDQDDDY